MNERCVESRDVVQRTARIQDRKVVGRGHVSRRAGAQTRVHVHAVCGSRLMDI